MAQLLSNLPLGSKLKLGKYSVNGEAAADIIWMIVAKNHACTPAYPTNCVTLLSEKILDLRPLDAKEPTNTNWTTHDEGNSRYSVSNMDQWLNKDDSAGKWYVAQHPYDQSPTSAYVVAGTEYASRAGFLNAFSDREKNALLSTTIRVQTASGDPAYEDITRKVFLASATEVGVNDVNDKIEGALWQYFSTNSFSTVLTNRAWSYTLSTSKPSDATRAWFWWLRTPSNVGTTRYVDTTLGRYGADACTGNVGVRPATNISSAMKVSDTTDADGCYTFIWNSAPTKPTALTTPTIYGGKNNPIAWGIATDPEGDTVTYQLECSINGAAYTQIYSGTGLNYAHLVPFGTSTVSYRVKAIDPSGESSEYTTSATLTVVNNNAPVISGADSNLGVKSEGFTDECTITDANSDAVTVTIAIDGMRIRSSVVTLGEPITYSVTENTWLALPNGSHTLTISATDGIDTSVRTYTFAKLVDALKIQNATPWAASTMPSRIMLVVTRNVPSTATFKVEVCNNGYDASPKWEDATDAVTSGLVHVFSNKNKTATNWGVLVRVTVERNGATGACYVSAIGGNFE